MSEPQPAAGSDILFERHARLGLVTLNRPQALNTLTLPMVRALDAQLRLWATDPGIATVAIQATGTRAFCAGGDIRVLYDLGVAGRTDDALQFWREEYPLNTRIKEYPKPYVALIAGIVMGGGVGVSIHGSHRVGLDEIAFAMPEVGIGFFPDVGATYFLPRMPPGVGMWLALTGTRVATADAVALGLLTHAAPKARKDEIIAALAAGEHPDVALHRFRTDVGQAPVRARLKSIARLLSGSSVEAIVAGLEREANGGRDAEIARSALDSIGQKSPTSLKIAFEQLRRGTALDFRGAMRAEYRIAARIVKGHDFYEGIRAVVVDKDNAPRWRPASLADVSEAEIAAYFEPPLQREAARAGG